ncbi:unnamed protein product [Linum trigynum]|uniref:Uncharacterized protein n=1 Tax=Linum trigynum TaxID=586398 RepID=A0AAV2GPY5_9ROSI
MNMLSRQKDDIKKKFKRKGSEISRRAERSESAALRRWLFLPSVASILQSEVLNWSSSSDPRYWGSENLPTAFVVETKFGVSDNDRHIKVYPLVD